MPPRSGREPALAPPPLRLSGPTVTRRASGADRVVGRVVDGPAAGAHRQRRVPRGSGRHGLAPVPDPRPHAVTGRRRRADLRAVVASILGVLALVGCVMAILMLATEPTAAKLESEIGSLTTRLGTAQSQLVTLQAQASRSAAQRSNVTREMNGLKSHLVGLQRTVHGLQSSTTLWQEQQAGLRACVPQLQQELVGLSLKTSSVHGHVTRVGLSDPPLLSAGCQSLLSGL